MRSIVVGDIHGCLEEFDELLKTVDYKHGQDTLILAGDLVDRGPDSPGVVRRAWEIGAIGVLGNHEEKALRWLKHEKRRAADSRYTNPMRVRDTDKLAEWKAIPEAHWDWIDQWPVYRHVNNKWSVVHAGCQPNKAVENQDPSVLLRVRYLSCTTLKMLPLAPDGKAPPDSFHWTKAWNGDRSIVYGHYTYMKGVDITPSTLGIDTGCVHGGELTAAIFEGDNPGYQLVSVKAKKIYVPRVDWTAE